MSNRRWYNSPPLPFNRHSDTTTTIISSSSSSASSSAAAEYNYLLACLIRVLTFKNLLIAFLIAFLLVSFGFSPGPLNQSNNVWYIYVRRANDTISVIKRLPPRLTHLVANLTVESNTTTTLPAELNATKRGAIAAVTSEIEVFESETNAIKKSIREAFRAAHKRIEYCPLNDNPYVQGPLDVSQILEKIGLHGLVQFHEKSMPTK